MADDAVRIEGLKDFVRELREVDKAFPKELRLAGKDIAEGVAGKTRASFAGGSGSAPKAAPSVKAGATQTGAYVRIGGDAYPTALGNEFGSVRYKQFPAWRGSDAGAGYHLYPTIRASGDEIEKRYMEAIDRVAAKAFPD